MFSVRISRSYGELKPFFDKLKEHYPQSVIVVYQHDADEDISRTHIHAMLENVNPSTDTLKRWVKDISPDKIDRYDWSWKVLRDREVLTYNSKGKLEPVLIHNIEYSEVIAFRAKWVEPSVKNPVDKREKITTYSIAKELASWINRNAKEWTYHRVDGKLITGEELGLREITQECIKLHVKYEKAFCDFSLIRVIHTAFGITIKERWRNVLIDKVVEKLSPRIL